ncbi:hypothetical protein ACIBHX_47875 [Nonomuraea sp. NPDC050536]|uniref:hypothetical protein n=1 Tax=Nonomuraea sp. NPDC050536 TaxID=3364366 RepID=UPI0037C4F2A1
MGAGSVAIHGDNAGVVITHAAGTPLAAALRGAGRLFEDSAAMTGRAWLTERVDAFLATHPRGYFLIEADAGLGKSTYAAWLAADRDYPRHFTREGGDVRQAATAIRNLGAQLVAGYGLDELAPGGLLPPESGGTAWLTRVLRAAASRRRVVLVVDGLDEAVATGHDVLPLGLPAELPDGVYVVATLRPGTPLPGLREPYEICKFRHHREENLADLRAHVEALVRTPELAAKIDQAGLTQKAAADLLVDRSDGVWVYLHYVTQAGALDLSLPRGLEDYYAAALAGLNEWLPVLATLAVAEEPLDADTLVRLAGTCDADSVTDLLTGPLRPFCRVEGDTFACYHASLRDYLTGGGAGMVTDAQESRRKRMARATRQAHDRICDHYLSLPEDLGYGRRHLATHLIAAGRADDLHRLLADHGNAWFRVHDEAGDLAGYLRDVALAREAADSIPLEIRYRLIEACVSSSVASLPTKLIMAMVETEQLTVAQAVEHARRDPYPARRVELLAGLLSRAPAANRDELFADATRAAGYLDAPLFAEAVVALLPPAGPDQRAALVGSALDKGLASRNDLSLCRVLCQIGPLLDDGQTARAMKALLSGEGHSRMSYPWLAMSITALAPALTGELAAHALEAVLAPPTVWMDTPEGRIGMERAKAIEVLAPRLGDRALHRALAAARELPTSDARFVALLGLSDHLPEPLIAEAVRLLPELRAPAALARAIPVVAESERASLVIRGVAHLRSGFGDLAELLAHVPRAKQEQAAAMLFQSLNESDKPRAGDLKILAPFLPAGLFAPALELARRIASSEAMTALAMARPPEHRRALLSGIRADVLAHGEGWDPSEVMAALACRAPDPPREALLARIREEPGLSDGVLAMLGPRLADAIVADMGISISADLFEVLAPHLSCHKAALQIARARDDAEDRLTALTALLPHLPAQLRTGVAREALDLVKDVCDRDWHLMELIPALPDEALGDAVTLALACHGPMNTIDALTALEPRLPETVSPLLEPIRHLRAEALDKARGYAFVLSLPHAAPHLDPPSLTRALDRALTLGELQDRVNALLALLPYLPEEQRQAAARAAVDPPALPGSVLWHPIVELAASEHVTDMDTLLADAADIAPKVRAQVLRKLVQRQDAGPDTLPRHWPDGITREDAFLIIADAAPWIERYCGPDGIVAMIEAVEDVSRWWP